MNDIKLLEIICSVKYKGEMRVWHNLPIDKVIQHFIAIKNEWESLGFTDINVVSEENCIKIYGIKK